MISDWAELIMILVSRYSKAGLPCWVSGRESACNAVDVGLILVGKIPWRRAWQPTPVFLPGESHGQRSLVGYSPSGRTESDMTEVTKQQQHLKSSFPSSFLFLFCLSLSFIKGQVMQEYNSKWLNLSANCFQVLISLSIFKQKMKKKRFNVTEEQNHDEFKWFWFSSHLPSEILLVYTSPVHIYLCIPVYTTSTVWSFYFFWFFNCQHSTKFNNRHWRSIDWLKNVGFSRALNSLTWGYQKFHNFRGCIGNDRSKEISHKYTKEAV